MPATHYVKGTFHKKRVTAAAGTAFTQLIEPAMKGVKTRITEVLYRGGNTAHTLTFLKALARTTAAAAAAASATELTVTSDSFLNQTIAASDYIVVKHSDGTFGAYLVSANASKVLTIPALSAAVAAGAPVWIMGATGESEHITVQSLVNTDLRLESAVSGVVTSGFGPVTYSSTTYSRTGNDDPILIHSNNATGAGVLENVSGYYGSP